MRPTRGLGSATSSARTYGCPHARTASSYLALLRAEFAAFHRPDRANPIGLRLCGTGPRLAADGRYPLPCAVELGLSSRARPKPSARDRPADSPRRNGRPSHPDSQLRAEARAAREVGPLERLAADERGLLIRPALVGDARSIAEIGVLGWQTAYRDLLPHDFLAGLSVDARAVAWRMRLADDASSASPAWVAERGGLIVGYVSTGPPRDEDVPLPSTEV